MSRNAFRKYSAIWHYCLAPHVVNSWVQEQPFTRPLRNNATSIFNSGLVPLSIWQNIGVALRGTSGLHNSTPKKYSNDHLEIVERSTDLAHLGLEFCSARKEHFEEVMTVSSGIFEGLDYLPDKYHSWLQEPNRLVFLAKKGGKVVALQSAVVIDYGRTAVVEGLRVAPWERGKGIAKAIYRYCRDTVKTYYPDVKTERMMMEGPLSQIPVSDTDLLCTRMILYLCFKTEDIQKITKELILKLSQTEEYHQPVTLQVDQVRNIYLNSKVILSLLPEKTIIQNWQPLKPLKKNLNILLDRGSTWLADSIDNPKFLSLDTYPYRVPLEKGYCFNIDLFGKDLTGAKNLFLGHMQSLPQSLNTLIFCHVYFDPSLKEGMVEFCEKIPGLERFKECSEQMLFEREI
ncbi:histidine N-acetyltransferase-like isoform X1 [Latimeria chalumnae]|uniref:histidine N-acetyltransferase-like isoform X1 n=1 Tax=Latimeria chalumnae TaxID=7897 RepID=UPI00313EF3C3